MKVKWKRKKTEISAIISAANWVIRTSSQSKGTKYKSLVRPSLLYLQSCIQLSYPWCRTIFLEFLFQLSTLGFAVSFVLLVAFKIFVTWLITPLSAYFQARCRIRHINKIIENSRKIAENDRRLAVENLKITSCTNYLKIYQSFQPSPFHGIYYYFRLLNSSPLID